MPICLFSCWKHRQSFCTFIATFNLTSSLILIKTLSLDCKSSYPSFPELTQNFQYFSGTVASNDETRTSSSMVSQAVRKSSNFYCIYVEKLQDFPLPYGELYSVFAWALRIIPSFNISPRPVFKKTYVLLSIRTLTCFLHGARRYVIFIFFPYFAHPYARHVYSPCMNSRRRLYN